MEGPSYIVLVDSTPPFPKDGLLYVILVGYKSFDIFNIVYRLDKYWPAPPDDPQGIRVASGFELARSPDNPQRIRVCLSF